MSRQKRMNDGFDIEFPEVPVFLSDSDEKDGLAGGIGHADGGPDLVIDCVELAENDAIDLPHIIGVHLVLQRTVELDQLIRGVVPH